MTEEPAMTPRERVMKLFEKRPIDHMPCFSGQGMVTRPAIESLGLRFPQIHKSAEAMAHSAIASLERYGFDAAVVPFDMCTVPEALGLPISLYEQSEDILYPTLPEKHKSPEEVNIPDDLLSRGRMPVVTEALSILKKKIGQESAIGTWLLGPFTMAGQLVDLDVLYKMTRKDPKRVEALLDRLTEMIIHLGQFYQELGADYVSLREMGAGTTILSPRIFRTMIQPHLAQVLSAWKSPKVLHICGSTDLIISMMNECGGDALSVDQQNNLAASREKVGKETLLFGNFDPFATLSKKDPSEVEGVVEACLQAGADAVWPGCDIWPDVQEENVFRLVQAVHTLGKNPSPAVGRMA
jgi:[methyl-Co(III) methanol-specific corrinoid protein]:coenzyme M methyltransferase